MYSHSPCNLFVVEREPEMGLDLAPDVEGCGSWAEEVEGCVEEVEGCGEEVEGCGEEVEPVAAGTSFFGVISEQKYQ